MKKIFLLVALMATVSTQLLFAQDNKSTSLTPLLASYYDIKDALIKSNSADAATHAGTFLKAVNGVDMKSLPAADMSTFMAAHKKTGFRCQAYFRKQGYRPPEGAFCQFFS